MQNNARPTPGVIAFGGRLMTVRVPLRGGRFALVDLDDAKLVLSHKWHLVKTGSDGLNYAGSSSAREVGSRQGITLHRFLMGHREGHFIDHINGDGLDNRRENLRWCKHSENIRNQRKRSGTTSRFKGVWRDRSKGLWQVGIEQDGHQLFLGSFQDEERAARQYDRAARLIFGPFARTNEMLGLF